MLSVWPKELVAILRAQNLDLFNPINSEEKASLSKHSGSLPMLKLPCGDVLPDVILGKRLNKHQVIEKISDADLNALENIVRNIAVNTPGQHQMSFEICNQRDRELHKYTFWVFGREEGRATKNRLHKDGYSDATSFQGDIIVPGNQCITSVWRDEYRYFPIYEIERTHGVWAERGK